MSNAKWGKTWYQPPTEIIRNGITYEFAMSEQEVEESEHNNELADILLNIKEAGRSYRIIKPSPNHSTIPNSKGELWITKESKEVTK